MPNEEYTMKYKCPCCGYLTFDEAPNGTFDICPVCFWEDDLYQKNNPESTIGANKVSLQEAKNNFLKYGAMEKRFIAHVRKPFDSEWE